MTETPAPYTVERISTGDDNEVWMMVARSESDAAQGHDRDAFAQAEQLAWSGVLSVNDPRAVSGSYEEGWRDGFASGWEAAEAYGFEHALVEVEKTAYAARNSGANGSADTAGNNVTGTACDLANGTDYYDLVAIADTAGGNATADKDYTFFWGIVLK